MISGAQSSTGESMMRKREALGVKLRTSSFVALRGNFSGRRLWGMFHGDTSSSCRYPSWRAASAWIRLESLTVYRLPNSPYLHGRKDGEGRPAAPEPNGTRLRGHVTNRSWIQSADALTPFSPIRSIFRFAIGKTANVSTVIQRVHSAIKTKRDTLRIPPFNLRF